MPGVGAIYRYFFALRALCKLLKKSGLQFSSLESRKFFTVFSQDWMTEIHAASSNAAFNSVQTLGLCKDPPGRPSRCHGHSNLMKCEGERKSDLMGQ